VGIQQGTRLGPHEILSAIGAGGMGEVYRARDSKLNRDVAVKILPESFAADPERVARFTREAKTLAALNHPHTSGSRWALIRLRLIASFGERLLVDSVGSPVSGVG
jgi:serine/threonine protein kinase